MNVTVVAPSAAGFLTVYPNGASVPNASNLNFDPGQIVPNLVTTKIGTGGVVNLLLSQGSAHVIVDVIGTYGNSSAAAGAKVATVTPVRKLDTRNGLGMAGGPRRIGPGETIDVTVASGNVNGVVVNVTGVTPSAGTYVTVFPGDVATPPNASNLNLVPGQVRPNLSMVRVPTTGPGAGKIRLYNAFGTVDLLVDVVATYSPGSTGDSAAGRVLPLDSPMRVVDTRILGGPLAGPNARLHDFTAIDDAVTPNVTGLVMNATALGATTHHVPHAVPRGRGAAERLEPQHRAGATGAEPRRRPPQRSGRPERLEPGRRGELHLRCDRPRARVGALRAATLGRPHHSGPTRPSVRS